MRHGYTLLSFGDRRAAEPCIDLSTGPILAADINAVVDMLDRRSQQDAHCREAHAAAETARRNYEHLC